ncbi:MAG: hypothetical protein ACRESZ_23040 [Methylococcales bacterium]
MFNNTWGLLSGINLYMGIRIILSLIALLVVGIMLAVALYPEPPAKLLTQQEGWDLSGHDSSKVPLFAFPDQSRHIRDSVMESPGGVLFRTWTPDEGIVPLEVTSSLFLPAPYMSVVITGTSRTTEGRVQAMVECGANGQQLDIFRGSVNNNVAEAIVVTPEGWCPGAARITFSSTEDNVHAGVGAVFEISLLSYLKSSFLGLVPYLITSLVVFAVIMFSGASLATRFLGCHDPSFPSALLSLAIASLGAFYLASCVPVGWVWVGAAFMSMAAIIAAVMAGVEARHKTIHELISYARIWGIASMIYFAILSLATNGVGHWQPNYRFWPATWSSDNELPWIFAEAIRQGWDMKGLFGGGWMPTDRPPLMAGAHLLLSDVFHWLQSGNDGAYLSGQAYNAAAVALNALWVPACWWLLATLRPGIDERGRMAILLLVGSLPFVLFNTIYGWPKAFGAAFALVAFGMAWQSREHQPGKSQHLTIVVFFLLGAFSMLAHASTALFLAPLGLLFLWWSWRGNTGSILIGLAIALALMASWSLYKVLVLPSADPVTKYALTGDYGFGHPDWSLREMLFARYRSLDFRQWLEIKETMLLQAFLPLNHPITQIGLNSDFGAGTIDKLRAWDFMLLSKGNLAIPAFVLTVIWVAVREFVLRRSNGLKNLIPFLGLIGVSIFAWLLVVLCFFVPPVLHVWPQAAVFGLALGSVVVVHERCPAIFIAVLFITMTYTGVVWLLSPLQSALSIDTGAALFITGLLVWLCVSKLRLISLDPR